MSRKLEPKERKRRKLIANRKYAKQARDAMSKGNKGRCKTCGGMVYMPCRKCKLEAEQRRQAVIELCQTTPVGKAATNVR